jgi:hypothetical protein
MRIREVATASAFDGGGRCGWGHASGGDEALGGVMWGAGVSVLWGGFLGFGYLCVVFFNG